MDTSVTAKVRKFEIEVRIKDERIEEVVCRTIDDKMPTEEIYKRKSRYKIEVNLIRIFRGNFEKFNEILHKIQKDEIFFAYGRQQMDDEKKRWVQKLEEFEKRVEDEKRPLQNKINKYTWSE